MEVKFADTFAESIERLIRSERWYNKLWQWIRRDVPHFWKNVWRFRKALSKHYWWDHHGSLEFMRIAFEDMAKNIEERGLEIDISRLKKVDMMRRAVELIKNYNEDNYIAMAEAELGELILHDWEFEEVPDKPGFSRLVDKDTPEEKEHNDKVYNRAREIEEQEWNELWTILKGQDHEEYKEFEKTLTEEEKKETDQYYKWFDGSGLKGWWD